MNNEGQAMQPNIYLGNAAQDGADFHGWFVGDLGRWCAENGIPYDAGRMDLRSTPHLEIKWGVHPRGQQRPGGWAARSDKISLSILLHGDFSVKFRPPEDPKKEMTYRLSSQGDYLLWREEIEHTWWADEDSLILTVRWKISVI